MLAGWSVGVSRVRGEVSRGAGQAGFRLGVVLVVLGWLVGGGPGSVAWAGDPYQGERVYQENCRQCHGGKGRPALPGVTELSWRAGGASAMLMTDRDLLRRIQNGRRNCPAYLGIITERDILDLITYLRVRR